ncbi:MAG: outer membrane beta-barrel family protein [Robiginitalea sp.]|uniref:outer membrane beta-barrel family protein n=1 Tax=Robiginitalea sp. TaxID=1902411 RepID=UPI003C717940
MKLKILLVLGLFPLVLTSQTFQISGSVKDTDGVPLPLANVLLLRAQDSAQIKGTSADDIGRFTLKDIEEDLYFLQATYFGYKSVLVPLEVRSDIRIGALIMEEEGESLDEVVVTGQRPTIERQADRIVFNVENTVISEGSTWDILRKAPGVVTVQDNLEIRGQTATVYLNDRKVQLSQSEILDLLKGLDGNAISSVEVIPVPPASFEAEDGPVLNIRTRQNILPGYKGSVRGQYTQAVFPKYSFATSHYFKGEKFGVFANYSINPRKTLRELENDVNFIDDQNTVFSRWSTDTEEVSRTQAQQLNLILDYDLSDRDQLNLTSNVTVSPNKTYDYNLQTVMRNGAGAVDSTLQTFQDTREDQISTSLDLNYTRKLKKEGATLKANGHYTYYEETGGQEGLTTYFDPSGAFLRDFAFSTDAEQFIDIFTGQADWYTPITSGSFEAGFKGSFIRSRNTIEYFIGQDNQRSFDIDLSDRFNYDEEVYAAYASLNKNWDPWTVKLGLRVEQTEVKAESLTLNEINRQSYLEFFPSVFVSRDLSETQSMSFSYARRLTRPNYADLNPFRFFLNENDFVQGNPNLVPAFSHNFNLNWSHNDTFYVDLYYRDNGNFLATVSFQDNDNLTLRETKQNVAGSRSYGLDFTVSTPITSFWYLYSYSSLFYEENSIFAEESAIETYLNKVTGLYGYLNNSLTLSKDGSLTGEVNVLYLSGFLDGASRMSETVTLDLGVRKTLWDDRAVISLVAEDVLGLANATYTTRYANQDIRYFSRPETRFVRLGFTYNFGNFRLQNRDTDLDKDELQRIENE